MSSVKLAHRLTPNVSHMRSAKYFKNLKNISFSSKNRWEQLSMVQWPIWEAFYQLLRHSWPLPMLRSSTQDLKYNLTRQMPVILVPAAWRRSWFNWRVSLVLPMPLPSRAAPRTETIFTENNGALRLRGESLEFFLEESQQREENLRCLLAG